MFEFSQFCKLHFSVLYISHSSLFAFTKKAIFDILTIFLMLWLSIEIFRSLLQLGHLMVFHSMYWCRCQIGSWCFCEFLCVFFFIIAPDYECLIIQYFIRLSIGIMSTCWDSITNLSWAFACWVHIWAKYLKSWAKIANFLNWCYLWQPRRTLL